MTRITHTASDRNDSALEKTAQVLPQVLVVGSPMIVTAVQRKANIGNYETIDIYAAIALPVTDIDLTDKEALEQALVSAAEFGFGVASRECGARYRKVKGENEAPRK